MRLSLREYSVCAVETGVGHTEMLEAYTQCKPYQVKKRGNKNVMKNYQNKRVTE